jgi:hypothetical protein
MSVLANKGSFVGKCIKAAASFQTYVLFCAVTTERKGEFGGARYYRAKVHSSVFSTNISTERTDRMHLGIMFLTHLQDLTLCRGLCLLIIICTPEKIFGRRIASKCQLSAPLTQKHYTLPQFLYSFCTELSPQMAYLLRIFFLLPQRGR